jgi:crotonobetainyl-CoA:carnitine CoA-transferase CaiB-like acyl-CoA transferase
MPPGAFCTMMLADMGADVLKIETPPAEPGVNTTDYINRNKRSITLNLKDPRAQEILQELARTADVLVEGFRPGVMQRLGGDYATLAALNPRLIYCSLSGFGQGGPYRDMPAHDLNYLSLAGVLNLIGEPDGLPAIPINIIADYAGASLHGVIGILLALFARERSGVGQYIDVAYLDATIALLAATPNFRDFLLRGIAPARGKGVFSGRYAYYGIYRTADDKLLSIACTEPWLWDNFCDAIQRPDFKALQMRQQDFGSEPDEAHTRARAELEVLFRTRTRDEWFKILTQADVCVGKVYEAPEVLADPQVRHRGMVLDGDSTGTVAQPGIAVKLSNTPGSVRSRPPSRGEHTAQVLQGMGYGESDIAALMDQRVV